MLRKLIIGTFILFHINIAVQFSFLNKKFLYLNVLNISWPMVTYVYDANSCQKKMSSPEHVNIWLEKIYMSNSVCSLYIF